MTENKQITNVFIISDSVGDTGDQVARAAAAQFLEAHLRFSCYPFTQTISLLDSILKKAEREKAMIFSTFVDPKLNQRTKAFCQEKI